MQLPKKKNWRIPRLFISSSWSSANAPPVSLSRACARPRRPIIGLIASGISGGRHDTVAQALTARAGTRRAGDAAGSTTIGERCPHVGCGSFASDMIVRIQRVCPLRPERGRRFSSCPPPGLGEYSLGEYSLGEYSLGEYSHRSFAGLGIAVRGVFACAVSVPISQFFEPRPGVIRNPVLRIGLGRKTRHFYFRPIGKPDDDQPSRSHLYGAWFKPNFGDRFGQWWTPG